MVQILKNNVSGVLASGIGATTTTMTLVDASKFPAPSSNDFYLLTLVALNANGHENKWEVVKVTAKASNTLTVVRAQEGTSGQIWEAGTAVQMRLTAGSVVTPSDLAAHTDAADPHPQYTHPTSHPPGIITQDANNRFVTDAEKAAWNGKAAGTHSHSAATTSTAGFLSASDKTKLDGIEAGAQVNTVTSVAGKTGAVTLAKADVGLGSVDNTSDADKPVSTAQAAADALRVLKAGDTMTGPLTLASEAIPLTANNLPTLRPSLLLDFANSRSVDPRVTFTRASTATRVNEKGLIEVVASGVPRIDFDPVTLACRGLLIEEQRTNLLLNSPIDGANLATQTVTVTATAYTLSFYGTGTIALSGAHVASAVGAGAYPSRTILTFTPTAGSLTLTVTGTVQFAQLEAGSIPTSYIPTTTAAATRAADVAVMTGSNLSSWYRQDEGTIYVDVPALLNNSASYAFLFEFFNSAALNNRRSFFVAATTSNLVFRSANAGGAMSDTVRVSGATINPVEIAAAWQDAATFVGLSYNSEDVISKSNVVVPSDINSLSIGHGRNNNLHLNGHIRRLAHYTKRLSNAELQALTTP